MQVLGQGIMRCFYDISRDTNYLLSIGMQYEFPVFFYFARF